MKFKQIVILCMAAVLALGSVSGCGNKEKEVDIQKGSASSQVAEDEDKDDIAEQNQEDLSDEEQEKDSDSIAADRLNDSAFCIRTEVYEEGEIHIEYPQVENLVNEEITEWYNKKFQSRIDSVTGEVEEGDILAYSETVNETFRVTYQSEDMISILIEGYFYAEGAAHPYAYSDSYNINLKTGESMSIMDGYEAEEIVNDLLEGQNYTVISDVKTLEELSGEYLDYANQEIKTRDRDFTLECLQNCDYDISIGVDGKPIQSEAATYMNSIRLKDGKWALCLSATHAMGDYIIVRYNK